MPIDDEKSRPRHSVEPEDERKDKGSNKHEVDAPSRRTDDETDDKTTKRQE